jgi:hypothetical protein
MHSGRAKINLETIMMSSTVVKKDTASRDITHGSSRAKINTETIMRHSTVVKNVNLEPIMMSSTVVKKDTASRAISYGSSRAKINTETIMRRSTVLTKDAASSDIVCTERRGFQHAYGSSTKPSSCRVKEANSLSLRKGSPKSKLAVKRDKQKKKKIESLVVVSSSPVHSLCNSFVLSSRPISCSGTQGLVLSSVANLVHLCGEDVGSNPAWTFWLLNLNIQYPVKSFAPPYLGGRRGRVPSDSLRKFLQEVNLYNSFNIFFL